MLCMSLRLIGSIAESAELTGNIAMDDLDSRDVDSGESDGEDAGETEKISLTGVNRTECLEGDAERRYHMGR